MDDAFKMFEEAVKGDQADNKGKVIVHAFMLKRWMDINGNSVGRWRFAIELKDSCAEVFFYASFNNGLHWMVYVEDIIRRVSPQFWRGRAEHNLLSNLTEGVGGVIHRLEADFKRMYAGHEMEISVHLHDRT